MHRTPTSQIKIMYGLHNTSNGSNKCLMGGEKSEKINNAQNLTHYGNTYIKSLFKFLFYHASHQKNSSHVKIPFTNILIGENGMNHGKLPLHK